jgi:hypothetical protein
MALIDLQEVVGFEVGCKIFCKSCARKHDDKRCYPLTYSDFTGRIVITCDDERCGRVIYISTAK